MKYTWGRSNLVVKSRSHRRHISLRIGSFHGIGSMHKIKATNCDTLYFDWKINTPDLKAFIIKMIILNRCTFSSAECSTGGFSYWNSQVKCGM